MRLEWLEDILAILHAGSLNRAAGLRHLTQPAFSRRIKSIEEYVGVELLDRTHKPAQLHDAVLEQQHKFEQLSSGLRELLYELRLQDHQAKNWVVIASQHSIVTSLAPGLIKQLTDELDVRIKLRSANRSECFVLLMTKQTDIALTYLSPAENLPIDEEYLEQIDCGAEMLVPVFDAHTVAELDAQRQNGELPVIGYPEEVFLGEVMHRTILPRLRTQLVLREKAESALTLAVLQLALAGVGVAWVPRSLAAKEIGYGNLVELSDVLETTTLRIGAVRLSGMKSTAEEKTWDVIRDFAVRQAGN